ncbi:hypothetical protein MRS44_013485 [Fusarium solani]|uniref:uncharacterized protein n=1 Tax=Fusarium solani TaxID=169388 RepID=UPI0032C41116|nr:hypothetical protein MRS44_013485 [Fusarium solani]
MFWASLKAVSREMKMQKSSPPRIAHLLHLGTQQQDGQIRLEGKRTTANRELIRTESDNTVQVELVHHTDELLHPPPHPIKGRIRLVQYQAIGRIFGLYPVNRHETCFHDVTITPEIQDCPVPRPRRQTWQEDQELGLLDYIAFKSFVATQTWSSPSAPPVLVTLSLDLSELNIIWNLLAVLEVSQTTPAATACLYFPRAQSKQAKTRKRNA